MSASSPNDTILKGLRREGELADLLLAKAGVVLTQGGEPTFLPENTDSPEWNLEALGEEKLSLAWKLCRELERSFVPGAVILRSNGKHYPGEPIPRWKLTMLRGPLGAKLWNDPSLLAHGERGLAQWLKGVMLADCLDDFHRKAPECRGYFAKDAVIRKLIGGLGLTPGD